MEHNNSSLSDPVFETKMPYYKVSVYPNKMVYTYGIFKKAITVPLNQVASVKYGGITNKVVIETTGGNEVKMVVKYADWAKLSDAINDARNAASR